MKTSGEIMLEFELDSANDKKRAMLYRARSEGKTIQEPTNIGVIGDWTDLGKYVVLHIHHRVKPEPKTIKEAARIYSMTPRASLVNQAEYDFKAGARYQRENPEAAEK